MAPRPPMNAVRMVQQPGMPPPSSKLFQLEEVVGLHSDYGVNPPISHQKLHEMCCCLEKSRIRAQLFNLEI